MFKIPEVGNVTWPYPGSSIWRITAVEPSPTTPGEYTVTSIQLLDGWFRPPSKPRTRRQHFYQNGSERHICAIMTQADIDKWRMHNLAEYTRKCQRYDLYETLLQKEKTSCDQPG